MPTNISCLTIALAAAAAVGASSQAAAQASAATAPTGATGLCRDGLYTYSKFRRGSCKGNGGIQEWFAASSDATQALDAAAAAPAIPPTLPLPVPADKPAAGRSGETAPRIHMVYMGGNDCPPCVEWRARELPRLRQTEAFQTVTFSYVQKVITSPVPPSIFLPADVKPLKEKLDFAGGGIGGSAQVAIFIDDELYDYYFGTRSAKEIEQMILSIRNGTRYPFERCLKRDASRGCAVKGS